MKLRSATRRQAYRAVVHTAYSFMVYQVGNSGDSSNSSSGGKKEYGKQTTVWMCWLRHYKKPYKCTPSHMLGSVVWFVCCAVATVACLRESSKFNWMTVCLSCVASRVEWTWNICIAHFPHCSNRIQYTLDMRMRHTHAHSHIHSIGGPLESTRKARHTFSLQSNRIECGCVTIFFPHSPPVHFI